jgi:hypothetical protein
MAQNGAEPQGAGLGEDFDLDADLLRNIAAALENNQLADQGQHAANQAGQPGVQLPAVQQHAVQQAAGIQPSPELDAFLENALRRSEERIANRFKDQLSSTVEDVLSSSLANKKRKADQLKNEGIKKQYIPIEEATLRMKVVRESLADTAEREAPIGPDDAAKLRDHLDEGILLLEKRMAHLEVAQYEGWDVAKKMEENALVIHLSDDMQQQLKKAKKEVKEDSAKKNNTSGKKFKKGGKFWKNNTHFGGAPQYGGFQKGPKGPCFSCGQAGHISQWCPNKGVVAANANRQLA